MKEERIKFWKSILESCLQDLSTKKIDLNSYALEDERELKFQRDLVGDFHCVTCDRGWDSTQIPVIFRYSASVENGGKILMEWFGQRCKNAKPAKPNTKRAKHYKYLEPIFDVHRANIVGMKLREKIGEKFYGEERPGPDYGGGDSGREPRKRSHDKRNCEACKKGVCDEERRKFQRGQFSRENPPYFGRRGEGIKIAWFLEVDESKHVLVKPGKPKSSTKPSGKDVTKSGAKASSKPSAESESKFRSKVSLKSQQKSKNNNGNLPKTECNNNAGVTDSLAVSLAKLQVKGSKKPSAKSSNVSSTLAAVPVKKSPTNSSPKVSNEPPIKLNSNQVKSSKKL